MALVFSAFVLAKMFGVSRQASVGWGAIAAMVFLIVSVLVASGVCNGGSRLDDDIFIHATGNATVFAFTVLFLAVCASAKVSTGVAAGLALIFITTILVGIMKHELNFKVRRWLLASMMPMIGLLIAGPLIRFGMKYDRATMLVIAAAVIVLSLVIHTVWLSVGHRKIEEAAAK